ncbi:MAG TPA: hypothetical protein VIJ68_04360 [Candidatus Saccharimonadales bacterium]
MAKSSEGKKSAKTVAVMDVSHPGKSAPAANSKSVIVPSRPIMKDPMMVEEGQPEAAPVKSTEKPKPELQLAPVETAEPDPPPASETDMAKDEEAPEADQKAKATQAIEAASAEAAKQEAAVEKLADSKQYYLPIDTVEKRRSRRFVGLGMLLSLLLIVAWADIALDAGIIQINGIKPVTHFFSN